IPPPVIVTRAPMAARFDFVPISRHKTRCLGLGMSCTRSDGGSPTFNRRMSMLPSFLISPKAAPRRLDNGREASPVAPVISSNVRSPLFRNKGDRTFEDITGATGLASLPLSSRRGAAFGDIRNDGNMDILLLNVGEPPSLLVQDIPSPRHRVLFRLVGTKSNRAAI